MSGRAYLSRDNLTQTLHDLGLSTDQVTAAFLLAERVHGNQRRAGGGPYLEEHIYPVTSEVASYLARYDSNEAAVAVVVSLLHDSIEDSNIVTEKSIEIEFGPVVARSVAILTKPGKHPGIASDPSEEEEARYVAGVANAGLPVRVIKVFDRLNNLAAVHHRVPSRQRVYLDETRKHYVALARSVDVALGDQMADLLNAQEERFKREYPD